MGEFRPKANRVTLLEPVLLGADQKLDLSLQDVGELLSWMSDHVSLVGSGWLKREEIRLDRMAVTSAE